MAARPIMLTEHATVATYAVATAATATKGMLAILSSDTTCEDGGADSDLGVGVFKNTAAAGEAAEIQLFGPVVYALVGTGGATRGKKAVHLADGFADAPAHDSDGGTNDEIYGIFMQSGIATDIVGMQLVVQNRGSA